MGNELALFRELRMLMRNQWASEQELREIQSQGLRRLIAHAYENVPYYNSVFRAAGCSPEDIRDVADLQRLPILTKEDLLQVGDDIYARNVDISKCVRLKTSGTAAASLELPWTKMDKDRRVIRELRALMANGYRLTDRMMLVIEPRWVIQHNSWFQKLGLLRRKCLSLYADPDEQLDWMERWRPQVLYGYTSGLHVLADELTRQGKQLPSPRLVMTSAERMEPAVRQSLKAAFGVNPVDFYGSMELGWIGWECPGHSGYHVNSDCLVVECLKDGRPVEPGQEGEFVVTNLQSTAAPLIRYATGDLGTISDKPCRCGRSLPLLSNIHGRVVDRIVLPTGQYLSPYLFSCYLEEIPGIKRFQLVQESIDRLVVNIVPIPNAVPSVETVLAEVRGVAGLGMGVEVRILDDIPREPSGKFKAVKSALDSESPRTARD